MKLEFFTVERLVVDVESNIARDLFKCCDLRKRLTWKVNVCNDNLTLAWNCSVLAWRAEDIQSVFELSTYDMMKKVRYFVGLETRGYEANSVFGEVAFSDDCWP